MKKEAAILVLAMVFPTLLTFTYFVLLSGEPGGIQRIAYGAGKIIQFALPVFWLTVICRPKESLRGLLRYCKLSFGRLFKIGIGFGLLVFAAMLFLYFWTSMTGGILAPESSAAVKISKKILGFGINNLALLILLGMFYSIIHSGLEEYYWRWFVFGRMKQHCPWLVAAVVSSLGFMSHHVIIMGTYFGYDSAACIAGSLGVAVGGFFWCYLYQKSGSIWEAWTSHGVIDAAIFTVVTFILCNAYL